MFDGNEGTEGSFSELFGIIVLGWARGDGMARKKKQEQMKTFIYFEIMGIVIIGLSLIALSNYGLVARMLNSVNRWIVGDFEFMVPLVFIYVGLFAMIKRDWPRGWTRRRTGVMLLIMAITLYSHMMFIANKEPVSSNVTSTFILSTTMESLKAGGQVGGGLIGGVLYAISNLLFASVGSYLMLIALLLVSLILIFHLSYVDIGKWIFAKFKRSPKPGKQNKISVDVEPIGDDEDPADDDTVQKAPAESWFSKFFKKKQTDKPADTVHEPITDPYQMEGDHSHTFQAEIPGPSVTIHESRSETPLIIRDFTEQSDPSVVTSNSGRGPSTDPLPPDDDSSFPEDSQGFPVHQLELPLYSLPSLKLLQKPSSPVRGPEQHDMMGNARKLEKTLENFGVRAKVIEVHRGPAVTRYELQPDIGVKVSRIVSLTDDIALALAAKDIRMEAPIPGKSAIGIEVPNSEVAIVTMREVMETAAFTDSSSKLTIAFGRDISGQPIIGNLAKMPHLLVAGATGSGKSVCINGIIISILYKAKPDEVKFLMVDPKMVELNMYNGIPHLLAPVVIDPRRASLALKKVVVEMEKRYELFSKTGTRNIEGYNALLKQQEPIDPNVSLLPYIVVIVDELADLMMVAANDVEDAICRLAQMARAAGIHLIIATQRPSVDVITGVIKANIPSRIAFGVSSQIDSRTILDSGGAEKLLGRGDMLYLPVGANKPIRVQGGFLSDKEVETVVEFCKNQEQVIYREDLVPEVEESGDRTLDYEDDLFDQAVMIVIEGKQASVSYLQRRLRIGYNRAARLIDMMEARGIIGPYEGSKPREVLMTADQFQQTKK